MGRWEGEKETLFWQSPKSQACYTSPAPENCKDYFVKPSRLFVVPSENAFLVLAILPWVRAEMLQWNKDLVYAFCLFVGFFWYISLSVSTAHSSPFFLPVTHLHSVIKLLDLCLAGTVAAAGGWGRAMKVCLGACLLHGRLPAVRHCQGRCYLTSTSSFWSPWWDWVAVEDPHFGTYDDISHLGLYFTAHDFLGSCLWLCFSNPRVNKMACWGTAWCTIQLMVCSHGVETTTWSG